MVGLDVGRYYVIKIWLSECSSDETTYWKFEGLSLVAWLGSVVWINLGTNEGIKLRFSYRKVIGTTLGAFVGFPIGTYVGSEIGSIEGYTGGAVDEKFYGF